MTANAPGQVCLMQGNEAIVRGAVEAGINFAASYPGSPSSQILGMLGKIARERNFYAQWAVNEVCALQACLGASFAGSRSICIVKQNGLLCTADALHCGAQHGVVGGVVIVTSDDPSAHSSTNEFDSRHQALSAEVPLLEPTTMQEAKDMVPYAFDLSERVGQMVILRLTTRVCHGRGNVVLGQLPAQPHPLRRVQEWDRMVCVCYQHGPTLEKLAAVEDEFTESPYNHYDGPENAELLVVAGGTGHLYAKEAIRRLGVGDRTGLLSLGTLWPLPEAYILQYLRPAKKVLVLEEVDPFLERNLLAIAGKYRLSLTFLGRMCEEQRSGSDRRTNGERRTHPDRRAGRRQLMDSGDGRRTDERRHVSDRRSSRDRRSGIDRREVQGAARRTALPPVGELDPDVVTEAVSRLTGAALPEKQVNTGMDLPAREMSFCAGCPHRATFFLLKRVLRQEKNPGIVVGDIGCYFMAGQSAGQYGFQVCNCMGSGINMAEGLGQLTAYGLDQKVVTMCGDSTFFHTILPGVVNASYHNANMLLIVLDNSATAMTGFQPHPGTGLTAMGDHVPPMNIQAILEAMGCRVETADPFEVKETEETLHRLLQEPGLNVLIMRQPCATLMTKQRKEKPRVWVDQEKCLGDGCGCDRYCSRVWGCPGNTWDFTKNRAAIDPVTCVGCGVCARLCPSGAIHVEGGADA